MNNLAGIAIFAGLQDAFQASVLLAASVLILLWLKSPERSVNGNVWFFVAAVTVLHWAFHLGVFHPLLFKNPVQETLQVAILFAAVFQVFLAAMFFYDWILLQRNIASVMLFSQRWLRPTGILGGPKRYILVFVLGLIVVLSAAVGSMDAYMSIISNNMVLPGRFWSTAVLLLGYTLVKLWPVFAVVLLFNVPVRIGIQRMVFAALCFSGGASAFLRL